jgi:hypothetical protein
VVSLNIKGKVWKRPAFKTIVFPVARAGAIFHAHIMTIRGGKMKKETLRYIYLTGDVP